MELHRVGTQIQNGEGIASMRLRDARDRSVMAYALLYGQKHVILDPGVCCKGKPVDNLCHENCSSGESIWTDIKSTDQYRRNRKIYPNEKRWRELLQDAAQQTLLLDNGGFWWNYLPLSDSEEPPCQKEVQRTFSK